MEEGLKLGEEKFRWWLRREKKLVVWIQLIVHILNRLLNLILLLSRNLAADEATKRKTLTMNTVDRGNPDLLILADILIKGTIRMGTSFTRLRAFGLDP